ncbi:MAG TPA: type IV pili twitching motility protein PilT, partial [Bacillota bacterium]|nr:type IV pili twitching motility protein PilT [Bacillota bacterium]
ILVVTAAVRNLIREQKTHQIYSVMQTGQRQGMLTMDNSLKELFLTGKISREEVAKKAADPEIIFRTAGGFGS